MIQPSSVTNSSSGSKRPQVGIGVLLLRGTKVLLGRRRNAHGEGYWAPPGGHLEYGESPSDCAAREVGEETGLTVQNTRLCGVTNDVFKEEQKHYVTLFMVASCLEGVPLLLEPEKCGAWEWFEWATLPEPLFLPLQHLLEQHKSPFEGIAEFPS
jgi:8-oxo-dGTP diphosphatase